MEIPAMSRLGATLGYLSCGLLAVGMGCTWFETMVIACLGGILGLLFCSD